MTLKEVYDRVKEWGHRHHVGRKLLILLVVGSILSVIATYVMLTKAPPFIRSRKLLTFFIREDLCTGCGACEEACPYHGIFLTDGVALKCDLCGGEPACVSVCYPKAIQYVDATDEAIMADLEHKTDKLKKIRSDLYE